MLDSQLTNERSASCSTPPLLPTRPGGSRFNGDLLDVYLDGSHAAPAMDSGARRQRIAPGAAVFDLRCAAASLRLDSRFSLYP
jgi:hypothetical protein